MSRVLRISGRLGELARSGIVVGAKVVAMGLPDVVVATTAARRALLETTWSIDTALRVEAVRQLEAALVAAADDLVLLAATETGVPVGLRAAHVDEQRGVLAGQLLADQAVLEDPQPHPAVLGRPC